MFGTNRKQDRFEEWNKAYVQMIMSRGFMSGQDMYRGVKSICETYQNHQRFPRIDTNDREAMYEMILDFKEKANAALEPIQLHIKDCQEEVKQNPDNEMYTQYYVMAPMYENETIAKLQKVYGEPELEWLKLVCSHLIENTEDRVGNQNELTNLCREGGNNSANKKLSVTEADKALKTFIDDGYLVKIKGSRKGFKIGLGARFIMEMDGWLEKNFEDEVNKCGVCDRIALIYTQCTSRKCDVRFHLPCVDKGKKDPKCNRCREPLKIEGVASKRS